MGRERPRHGGHAESIGAGQSYRSIGLEINALQDLVPDPRNVEKRRAELGRISVKKCTRFSPSSQ